MGKEMKRYWIIGIIFTSVVGTLSHFVYEWTGENRLAGLFVPVNESTWEHIKLLFFPMLLYTFYVAGSWKGSRPCGVYGLFAGNLLGCLLIPVLFYTYSGILGYHISAVDIAIFFVSVLAAFYTAYRLTLSCRAASHRYLLTAAVLLLTLLFWIFTYRPPAIGLFANP